MVRRINITGVLDRRSPRPLWAWLSFWTFDQALQGLFDQKFGTWL